MNNITLDLRGTLWNKLQNSEKDSIEKQFPNIYYDANLIRYRFVKSIKNGWCIVNALTLPVNYCKVY